MEIVRGRAKPTSRVRLLLRAAIRDRTKGRDEPVVTLRPLVVLRHPDVAREGYIKSVTVGTEVGALVITDAGRTWLEQDRWANHWWRSVFG